MQHLDDSLLGMPDIALEASQRTLENVAQELFEKQKEALEHQGLAVPREFFHHIQNSLEQLCSFISCKQVDDGDERLSQQRIAQLHAVDLLLRLNASTPV